MNKFIALLSKKKSKKVMNEWEKVASDTCRALHSVYEKN